jgi:hypothetical protein
VSAVARALCAAAAVACAAAPSAKPASSPATRQVVVGYRSAAELTALENSGARLVQTLPALRGALVETSRPLAGSEPVLRRALAVDEPALAQTFQPGIAWEWQWDAARMEEVPDWVLRAASGVTVAVIDSGADLRAPDLADKSPATWSVLSRSHKVRDRLGHGTFVASLATGSVVNGVGISGFGGDAQLLVVQAIDADGYITDVEGSAPRSLSSPRKIAPGRIQLTFQVALPGLYRLRAVLTDPHFDKVKSRSQRSSGLRRSSRR